MSVFFSQPIKTYVGLLSIYVISFVELFAYILHFISSPATTSGIERSVYEMKGTVNKTLKRYLIHEQLRLSHSRFLSRFLPPAKCVWPQDDLSLPDLAGSTWLITNNSQQMLFVLIWYRSSSGRHSDSYICMRDSLFSGCFFQGINWREVRQRSPWFVQEGVWTQWDEVSNHSVEMLLLCVWSEIIYRVSFFREVKKCLCQCKQKDERNVKVGSANVESFFTLWLFKSRNEGLRCLTVPLWR